MNQLLAPAHSMRAAFGRAFACSVLMMLLLKCDATAQSPDVAKPRWSLSQKRSLVHDGKKRTYLVYARTSPIKKPSAAVLLLHGHGGSADQLMGETGRRAPYRIWMDVAKAESVVLIIPDGLIGADGKQGWNDARRLSSNPDADDVEYLCNLIELVSKSSPIDRQRVFAVGTSNGGHMALRLAADASDKFAAVAAIAAANPNPIFANQPEKPVSVLLINGTNDRILPFAGGKMIGRRGSVQSTADSIKYWVKHNRCADNPEIHSYPDLSSSDGCTAHRSTYTNDATNVQVGLIRIEGGGHTEPSIKQPYSRLFRVAVGSQNHDIEMADEVWKFFQAKTLAPAK